MILVSKLQALKPVLFIAVAVALMLSAAEAKAKTVTVDKSEELNKAVSAAEPGDIIILADGQYDKPCKLNGKGTADKPIVIQAQSRGKVNIRNSVLIQGEYLYLIGVSFTHKGNVEINGMDCRLSRCHFSNVRTGKWIQVGGGSRRIEIDHCLFERKENNRQMRRGCQLIRIVVSNKDERHHIHHNHFRDIPKGATGNGFETLQLITGGNPKDPKGARTGNRVENNLFERCDGESEIISVKSNGNILKGNTFLNCQGELVLRQGHRNVVNGNWFIGGTGGIRLQGQDQVVVNNYFDNLTESGLRMMNGIKKDGKPFYVRVERSLIAHNTFIDCQKTLVVGINHSKCPPGVVPKDCTIANNIFYHDNDKGVGHIEFIDGKEPENWMWVDNIVQGKPGISSRDGISKGDPKLKKAKNGILRPTKETQTSKHDFEDIKYLNVDLLGNTREGARTLGAIQYLPDLLLAEPLTEKDVGPNALMDE